MPSTCHHIITITIFITITIHHHIIITCHHTTTLVITTRDYVTHTHTPVEEAA
jgi:hypothetical protein